MRVLIINKFLYPNGGSETYIFKLGEALEQTDTKFSTSVWSMKVAAWATVSMLIHLIWTSTAAAN